MTIDVLDGRCVAPRDTLHKARSFVLSSSLLRAYRWTFIVSGLEHPNFVRIVTELTEHGAAKIAAAAQALAA